MAEGAERFRGLWELGRMFARQEKGSVESTQGTSFFMRKGQLNRHILHSQNANTQTVTQGTRHSDGHTKPKKESKYSKEDSRTLAHHTSHAITINAALQSAHGLKRALITPLRSQSRGTGQVPEW